MLIYESIKEMIELKGDVPSIELLFCPTGSDISNISCILF